MANENVTETDNGNILCRKFSRRIGAGAGCTQKYAYGGKNVSTSYAMALQLKLFTHFNNRSAEQQNITKFRNIEILELNFLCKITTKKSIHMEHKYYIRCIEHRPYYSDNKT